MNKAMIEYIEMHWQARKIFSNRKQKSHSNYLWAWNGVCGSVTLTLSWHLPAYYHRDAHCLSRVCAQHTREAISSWIVEQQAFIVSCLDVAASIRHQNHTHNIKPSDKISSNLWSTIIAVMPAHAWFRRNLIKQRAGLLHTAFYFAPVKMRLLATRSQTFLHKHTGGVESRDCRGRIALFQYSLERWYAHSHALTVVNMKSRIIRINIISA